MEGLQTINLTLKYNNKELIHNSNSNISATEIKNAFYSKFNIDTETEITLLHKGNNLTQDNTEFYNNDIIYAIDKKLTENIELNLPQTTDNNSAPSGDMMDFMNDPNNLSNVMSIMSNPAMQNLLNNKNLIKQMMTLQNGINNGEADDISEIEKLMQSNEIQNLVNDTDLMGQMYNVNSTLDPNFANEMPDMAEVKEKIQVLNNKPEDPNLKKYESELKKLNSMGITDTNKNIEYLEKYNGDVKLVIKEMMNNAGLL